MMRRRTVLAAIATIPSGAILSGQAPSTNVARTILELEGTRRQALLRGDVAVIASLLADDFIEITATGSIRRKTDNLDLLSGRLKWLEATTTDEDVRVFGSFAVFTATMRNRGTLSGQPWERLVRVSRVYVPRGGKWLCVHAQSTPVAP